MRGISMYYQNYEDYMRSVLGYPCASNMYESNEYYPSSPYATYSPTDMDCSRLYPEIYKIAQPLIINTCMNVSMPITEEWLNEAAEAIYDNLQRNDKIVQAFQLKTVDTKSAETKNGGTRQETTRRRSNILLDFIRILLLNQILGGQNRPPRPPRPPHPPYPPRPPYPGGPTGMPRPRDFME